MQFVHVIESHDSVCTQSCFFGHPTDCKRIFQYYDKKVRQFSITFLLCESSCLFENRESAKKKKKQQKLSRFHVISYFKNFTLKVHSYTFGRSTAAILSNASAHRSAISVNHGIGRAVTQGINESANFRFSCRHCPSYLASAETVRDFLHPADTIVLG